jgi:site-specific DNA-methyltransferase (adenine-specific)
MVSEVYNEDCMIGMKRYPDKFFELAIVDPPYGIGENGERSNRPRNTDKWKKAKPKGYELKDWDVRPDVIYFNELARVSKNQIIWGANHFYNEIQFTSHSWIFWDKVNGSNDFADGELAWTSFNKAVRKFEWLWNGFQKQRPEERTHPTQKPVALYKWLLTNYAKPGDKILDTHLGSGSSRIAAYDMGFDFYGFELDKDYYQAQEKRFAQFKMQGKLFT